MMSSCRDTAASERGGRDSQDVGRKQVNEGHTMRIEGCCKVRPAMMSSCRDTAASERGGRDSQDVGRKQVNEGHTMGIVETRAYKSAPSGSTSRSSEARVVVSRHCRE